MDVDAEAGVCRCRLNASTSPALRSLSAATSKRRLALPPDSSPRLHAKSPTRAESLTQLSPVAARRAASFNFSPPSPLLDLSHGTRVHFFWGDERNVPPGHPESNYSMARELLLSQVPVPPAHIHRIPTGDGTAIEAADLYERVLREKLPTDRGLPRLDYVLLGLGANGHTASLFPNRSTLHERQRLVIADHVDEVNSWRVTLTAPVLNNASQITFLVIGEDKAAVVEQVIQGARDVEAMPAQLIAPVDGVLTWILDPAAASRLTRPARQQ